jgi:hypothetical protein
MSIELLITVISAVVALTSAALTGLIGAWTGKQRDSLHDQLERQRAASAKQEVRQDLMSRFRDPLLWAAFDLQSRVYNIVAQGALRIYLSGGTPAEQAYVRRNTMFVVAEYLGWVEIVRRRVQFLDLGSRETNRQLVSHLSKISGILNTHGFPDQLFRIFRGEQRAIGEVMIDTSAEWATCIGYAEFCAKLENNASFAGWFTRLSDDIDQLAEGQVVRNPRLVELQNAVVDLIDFLDPESIRFPDHHRSSLLDRSRMTS